MGLKEQVLSGVAAARDALDNLKVQAKLVVKGAAVHTPGQPPVYPETLSDVYIVLTSYTAKEVDNDRILVNDVQGLVFADTGGPVAKANDVIRVPTNAQVTAGDYRVIHNDKVMAGDTVALSVLQLRLL